eukprot:9424525-Pyramimonas_sp.AAC.2
MSQVRSLFLTSDAAPARRRAVRQMLQAPLFMAVSAAFEIAPSTASVDVSMTAARLPSAAEVKVLLSEETARQQSDPTDVDGVILLSVSSLQIITCILQGEQSERVGSWTQGEKMGRVSGVLRAPLPLLLAQEDPYNKV